MAKIKKGIMFLRLAAVMILSFLLPVMALIFYFYAVNPQEYMLPALWSMQPELALRFVLFYFLAFGVPSALGLIYLRAYPERVQLYPYSCSLIPILLGNLLFGSLGIVIPVAGVFLQGILFLTLPLLKPSKRLGEFERIIFPTAFSGCLLVAGCGAFFLSLFIGLSSNETLILILLPLLTLIGFLLIGYGGNALYKMFHPKN